MSNGIIMITRYGAALWFCVAVTVFGASAPAGNVPDSYGEAMAWYGDEARAGNFEAQYLLAFALETGAQNVVDREQARIWYAAAAEQNHPRAQLRLAIMLVEGRGGAVDQPGARHWLEQAAEQGEIDAMSLLGFLLVTTEPIDTVAAYRWFSLAARTGDGAAAANLAALAATMTADERATAEDDLEAWVATH
ncbi:MAG: sel1 repeat family protein [Rhodospirillaceae bacterium]|nr:sel1 repeat family protein [Rhodospirillaceae bacterium]